MLLTDLSVIGVFDRFISQTRNPLDPESPQSILAPCRPKLTLQHSTLATAIYTVCSARLVPCLWSSAWLCTRAVRGHTTFGLKAHAREQSIHWTTSYMIDDKTSINLSKFPLQMLGHRQTPRLLPSSPLRFTENAYPSRQAPKVSPQPQ